MLEQTNRLEDALQAYSRALDLAATIRTPAAAAKEILSSRSDVLLRMGQSDESLKDYQRLLTGFTTAEELIGLVWSETGRDRVRAPAASRITNRPPARALLLAQKAAQLGIGRRRPSGPILPRNPSAGTNLMDLTDYYHLAMNEDHGVPATDLTTGLQTLNGLQFDVRGVIQLYGHHVTLSEFPIAMAGIKVGTRCAKLHFLHAAQGGAAEGTLVGQYLVRYADGEQLELPIVYGSNLRDWWISSDGTPELRHASVAWTGTTRNRKPVRLFVDSWENPRPTVEVTSLDFISAATSCAPFLIAITAE